MSIVDLTQELAPGMPDWDGCCGFNLSTDMDLPADGVCVQSFSTPSGIGTHMDAPCHFIGGGLDIAAIPLDKLLVEVVVIDVSASVTPGYYVSLEDIQRFEQAHGGLTEGSLVVARTGWGRYWSEPDRYRNVDAQGNMCFPGFSAEAVDYLLQKQIVGIGIDTLSPDGGNMDFPVHKLVLGAGCYILENLCNLEKLPPRGAQVVALPIKIRHGSEAPCRVIALL